MTEKQIQQNETAFRAQVPHYLLCFVDSCPLHRQCLRWLAGRYAPTDQQSIVSINPRHPQTADGSCHHYRKAVKCKMARGLKHFYNDKPRRMEHDIKNALIGRYGRTIYYQYHNGRRLIPPAMQADLVALCRHCGWTAEPRYDGWEDDWQW